MPKSLNYCATRCFANTWSHLPVPLSKSAALVPDRIRGDGAA
jgi:hypothetical protein